MKKYNIKLFTKLTLLGVFWAIVFCIIGFIIVKFKDYTLKDVLFIEGIAVVSLTILSFIGINPMGNNLQALGQSNAQYVSNANLEVTKMEKEKNKNGIKPIINIGFNRIALIIGGIICIIINYMI